MPRIDDNNDFTGLPLTRHIERPSDPEARINRTQPSEDDEDVNAEELGRFGNEHRPMTYFVTGKRDAINQNTSEKKDRDWLLNAFQYFSNWNAEEDYDNPQGYNNGGLFGHGKTAPDIRSSIRHRGYRSYVDTSLGGNFPVNTDYSYTDYADIKMDRKYPDYGFGMGRFYYDSIESNAHDIHMRFGVQKFSSGLMFFTSWFDYFQYSLTTHGRTPSFLYDIGKVAGIAMGFAAPQILLFGVMIRLIGVFGNARFWYVSPSMAVYWTAVQHIFNQITGAMGMTLPPTADDGADLMSNGSGLRAHEERKTLISKLAKALPGVYQAAMGATDEGFNIDIRRMINRTQALENQLNETLQDKFGKTNMTQDQLVAAWDKAFQDKTNGGVAHSIRHYDEQWDGNTSNRKSTRAYLQHWLKSKLGQYEQTEETKGKNLQEVANETLGRGTNNVANETGSTQEDYGYGNPEPSLVNLFVKALRDGSDWLTLRVNGQSSVSESFSNSSEESALASTINSFANTARQARFNLMDGGILGDLVGDVLHGVTDLVQGNLDTLGLGGVTGFLFGAKVDIAKTYANSSVSFPNKSYTLKLRAPYGNQICIAQDLYIPLACILAGTLPLSHGRNAYGGPFYCELYDRGRLVVKNGLISSLTIDRGTSGIGWTRDGLPLGLDISFTVENLDTAMHVPIQTMSMWGVVSPVATLDKIVSGNEGAFQDYVSILSGLSLPDMIYKTNIYHRNCYQFVREWSSFWDRDAWVQRIASSAPGNVMKLFVPGTDRR